MDPHSFPQPVWEALEGRPVGFTSETTPALPGTGQVSESWSGAENGMPAAFCTWALPTTSFHFQQVL